MLDNLTWFCEDSNVARFLVSSLNKMTSNDNKNFNGYRSIPNAIDAGRRFISLSDRVTRMFDIPGTVTSLKTYANDHPIFVLSLALMATVCAIPILTFICFVVATLGLTFMGFIFVEGTLLTVGTFLLSGVLFIVGFLALGFSAIVAAMWFIVNKAFGAVSSTSSKLRIRNQNKAPIANGLYNND